MVIAQSRSKRKPSGSRYKTKQTKRLHAAGGLPSLPRIGETSRKVVRAKGSNQKQKLLNSDIVNLLDKKTKKFEKVAIKSVADCPANKNYVRRNIMTKGTVIETEKGKAVITSRPGQTGTMNAVLI